MSFSFVQLQNAIEGESVISKVKLREESWQNLGAFWKGNTPQKS